MGALVVVLFAALAFGHWKTIETTMNEDFSTKTEHCGFVLQKGVYTMRDENALFQLPDQKLLLFKNDFTQKLVPRMLRLTGPKSASMSTTASPSR